MIKIGKTKIDEEEFYSIHFPIKKEKLNEWLKTLQIIAEEESKEGILIYNLNVFEKYEGKEYRGIAFAFIKNGKYEQNRKIIESTEYGMVV